ncbi:MAG: hypothetical protein D6758_02620 [Gammaproteobacteria bacterium]|nr:MAG: hypothetical protein D6758_02620 [Gammaproteobacteria bacterium]
MRRWITGWFVLLLSFNAMAEALAPEFEVDRLMLALEEHLEAGNWQAAEADVRRLEALKPEKPPAFNYLRAKVALKKGDTESARNSLITYVNAAGREGQYYREALRLINELDERTPRTRSSAEASSTTPARPVQLPAPEQTETRAWLARLQELYLKKDPVDALVEHANALLAASPVLPGRLRHLDRREGIEYRLDVSEDRGEIRVRRSDYTQTPARHEIEALSVFGVDPYLDAGCSDRTRRCWIWHPVHADQVWLEIGRGGEPLSELQRTLSELIRQLQSRGRGQAG